MRSQLATCRINARRILSIKSFFSIVIPLYMTNKEYLKEMINSICAQTYGNWELCLADGSGKNSPLTDILEDYTKKDTRIRFCTLEENLGISGIQTQP